MLVERRTAEGVAVVQMREDMGVIRTMRLEDVCEEVAGEGRADA